MGKQKYYVVWNGVKPGIYTSWTDCLLQTKGYEKAKYKSFASREEAERAFACSPYEYIGQAASRKTIKELPRCVIKNSLAVDAACSGNPGMMEYRGVHLTSREEIFHIGPMKGTNNIGEFLAIVHGLAVIKTTGEHIPIYTDSMNAMKWVREKKCKTTLERTAETEYLFQLIERAEKWLKENDYTNIPIIKWKTSEWGEIPADFGRKR
jgi:ribonuclease HI